MIKRIKSNPKEIRKLATFNKLIEVTITKTFMILVIMSHPIFKTMVIIKDIILKLNTQT